ncbi:MAG: aminodeoxychorismate lyase, partial [Chitinophagaceae bacterium]
MKKGIFIFLFLILTVLIYCAWQLFGPVVTAPEGKYFYVRTGDNVATVKQNLLKEGIIKSSFFYTKVAAYVEFDKSKPGRYKIEEGLSIVDLVRKLRRGNQEPVKLVINKLRTKEDLAGKIGRQFECDSTEAINFLLNNDSLRKFGVDTHTVMTLVIPNTYEMNWNGNFNKVIS